VNKLVFGACHIVTGADTYLMFPRRRPAKPGTPKEPTRDSIREPMYEKVVDYDLVTDELVDYLYRMATGRPDLQEARRLSVSTYYDHGPHVANIKAPSLIIWGRRDRICPFDVGLKSLNHLETRS